MANSCLLLATDERLRGAVVVASVSGGKDSTAMAVHLLANGIRPRFVFADTGWEAPETYAYVDKLSALLPGGITRVSGGSFEEACLRHAMFPSRLRRFCTTDLKIKPIGKFIASVIDEGSSVVNAIGIRAGESAARSKLPEWEWSDAFDCWTWRPLLSWSEEDVIRTHKENGIGPNPLYLKGHSRVGCWPCIFSRKAELRLLPESQIKRIELLEQAVAAKAAERRHKLNYGPPAMFQATTPSSDGKFHGVPIRDVIDWASTDHGGKQRLLFPDNHGDDGCVKWGMCETNTEARLVRRHAEDGLC